MVTIRIPGWCSFAGDFSELHQVSACRGCLAYVHLDDPSGAPIEPVVNPQSGLARYPAISDYAVIGDCRTAALISRGGAIEWLCLPHFSAPSVFAAMLDRQRGGYFSVSPDSPYSTARRNILETTSRTFRWEGRYQGKRREVTMMDMCCGGWMMGFMVLGGLLVAALLILAIAALLKYLRSSRRS